MKTIAYALGGVLASALLCLDPAAAQPMAGMPGGPPPGPYEAGFQDGIRMAMAHMQGGGETMGHMEGSGEKTGSAAQFEFIRGNAKIEVKCAPRDTTEVCVKAAIALMDHIAVEKKEMAEMKPAPLPGALPPPPPAH